MPSRLKQNALFTSQGRKRAFAVPPWLAGGPGCVAELTQSWSGRLAGRTSCFVNGAQLRRGLIGRNRSPCSSEVHSSPSCRRYFHRGPEFSGPQPLSVRPLRRVRRSRRTAPPLLSFSIWYGSYSTRFRLSRSGNGKREWGAQPGLHSSCAPHLRLVYLWFCNDTGTSMLNGAGVQVGRGCGGLGSFRWNRLMYASRSPL